MAIQWYFCEHDFYNFVFYFDVFDDVFATTQVSYIINYWGVFKFPNIQDSFLILIIFHSDFLI